MKRTNKVITALIVLSMTAACSPKVKTVAAVSAASSTDLGALNAALSFTAGYYSSVNSSSLPASKVCSDAAIFGITGLANCAGGGGSDVSNACRDVGTAQITLSTETTTYAGSGGTPDLPAGFRDVPNVLKDDDGYLNTDASATCATDGPGGTNTCSPIIAVTFAQHAAFVNCGTIQNTIADRIADCASVGKNGAAATWNGETKGTHGELTWKLVTRSGLNNEVWQDQKTGLVWSSFVIPESVRTNTGGDNWCRAAGNAQADDPNNYCNSTTYQPEYPTSAESLCAEGAGLVQVPGWCDNGTAYASSGDCTGAGGTWTANTENYAGGIYSAAKGGMGANASSAKVRWRLPTIWDYQQANINGIRSVMPDMGAYANANWEWSASSISYERLYAWILYGSYGYVSGDVRTSRFGVRCVGR